MLKSTKSKSNLRYKSILIIILISAFVLTGVRYVPHKTFDIPSPTLHFVPTETTTPPIEFSFCYGFGNFNTDGKFNPYEEHCIDHLFTDENGLASLPTKTISTTLRFAHITNLNIRTTGVKNGRLCAYDLTLLPDPWRSDGSDPSAFGFSEIPNTTITLECHSDPLESELAPLRNF